MSQYNRRTIVRGAAWSIPVVAVSTRAPAFAASTDAPQPGSMAVTCRTNGQGHDNCQGYRVVLNFQVEGTYSWNIRVTPGQITSSAGATLEIKQPAVFPYVVSAVAPTMSLWFCASSSSSGLRLNLSYSVWRSDRAESTAVVYSFPERVFPGGSIPLC